MSFVETYRGDSQLVLGLPHTGTEIPEFCRLRLNESGRAIADTDWRIHDLSPGQNTTGLRPLTDFDCQPICLARQAPDSAEITARCATYHSPCHSALNGRFKGGWTTRRYGRPTEGFHAIHMESAQSANMQESLPRTYNDEKADRLRKHPKSIFETLSNWRLL